MDELLASMGEELTEGWSGEQARAWRTGPASWTGRCGRPGSPWPGAESLRLNPRQRRVREGASSLQAALATLEHAAVQVRGITIDLADLAEAVEAKGQAEPELLVALGRLLVELGGGVAAFGQLVAPEVAGPPREAVPLHIALEIARTHRDVLAELMLVDARTDLELAGASRAACWPTSTGCCARSTWSGARTPATCAAADRRQYGDGRRPGAARRGAPGWTST